MNSRQRNISHNQQGEAAATILIIPVLQILLATWRRSPLAYKILRVQTSTAAASEINVHIKTK